MPPLRARTGDVYANAQTIPSVPAKLNTTTLGNYLNDVQNEVYWNAGCGQGGTGPDRIFAFTANASTTLIDIGTCGYNTQLGLVDAASGTMLACSDDVGWSQTLYSFSAALGLDNCWYYSSFLAR